MSKTQKTMICFTLAGTLLLTATTVRAGNTAYGVDALLSNTTGDFNSAFGDSALRSNTFGSNNTASGFFALYQNLSGNNNSAIGGAALVFNTTGEANTASGGQALYSNTIGNNNTANGYNSLYYNTTGSGNTAIGFNALLHNQTSDSNAAVGAWALYNNTTGEYNLAFGASALYSNTSGVRNMGLGSNALYRNTTGSYNVGAGEYAGYANATGSNNVFIGRAAGLFEQGSNKLYIAGNTIRPLLYGIFSETAANNKLGIGQNTVPVADAIAVWNGARLTTGGVWTDASSRDLKDDIKQLSTADADAALESLSPVRYVYKNSRDEENLGFIAEDVPELVASNDRKSLSPMDIVAVLTAVMKEQKAENAQQKNLLAIHAEKLAMKVAEIAALQEELRKQDARIVQMEAGLAQLLQRQSDAVRVSMAN